jgi:hypothetical protein
VQQHLAEVLRLRVFLRGEVELRQLGDAVDEEGTSSPNSSRTSSRVALVSSTVSWSSAAQSEAGVRRSSVIIFATAMGCVKYASPDLRFCPSWWRSPNSNARRSSPTSASGWYRKKSVARRRSGR